MNKDIVVNLPTFHIQYVYGMKVAEPSTVHVQAAADRTTASNSCREDNHIVPCQAIHEEIALQISRIRNVEFRQTLIIFYPHQ
jgi:hypothetical protein